MKPAVSYCVMHIVRSLIDQTFAEKPVAHNLLQACCRLIDSLHLFNKLSI